MLWRMRYRLFLDQRPYDLWHWREEGRMFSSSVGPSLWNVRHALLAHEAWLFVATEELSLAVRAGDGLAIPWPSDVQTDMVLHVAKLCCVFAMSSETHDSVLCAWHCDGREIWKEQTGLKLLQPLYFIDRVNALCAGCFEGIFLWDATNGSLLRRMNTELPVDRIWHFELPTCDGHRDLLCARSSEVLGLTSQLLVWSSLEDDTVQPWQKTTNEMIMAVASDDSRLFARVGQAICAWDRAGKESWQRQEPMLPRLPTLPTRLQLSMGNVYVAAGHLILALTAETGELHFKVTTTGSVVKVYPISTSYMVSLIRSSNYSLGFLNLSQGELKVTSLRGEIPKASIAWNAFVIVAVVDANCDSDQSSLVTYDFTSGRLLWQRCFDQTLQSLCKDQHRIFAGGVGFISALDPREGSILWHTQLDGMVKALTLIAEKNGVHEFCVSEIGDLHGLTWIYMDFKELPTLQPCK
ncbi:unnamed protein product [Cladocopium goreaui]|uniref:Pyrrolo-quinoline quinone repeat domain-containing protein n=1 Tax=Cladocopium goreaui TaxID=2562237 RepID=A0A9P1GDG9_9DINO|nr:unnamed protein product [Cladocopium goreaui]